MIKSIRNMSIKSKITLSFICFIIIPITVLCLYSYLQTQKYIHQQIMSNGQTSLAQITYSIDKTIDIAESISDNITFNSTLQTFLSEPYTSLDDYRDNVVPVVKYETLYQKINIQKIAIYMSNHSIPEGYSAFYHDTVIQDEPWYEDFMKSDKKMAWVKKNSGNNATFAYLQKIYSVSSKYLGITSVDVLQKELLSPITDYPQGENLMYAVNSSGELLYNDNKGRLKDSSLLLDYIDSRNAVIKNDSIGITETIRGTDIKLIMLLPLSLTTASLQIITISAIIGAIITMLILFYLILKVIFGKMKKSIKWMDQTIESGMDSRIPIDRNDEFGVIAGKFNLLLEKISTMMNDMIKKEIAHKDVQLRALQLQINPHFVYNTIDIFSAKMELAGQYEVSEAFSDFGKMLRYSNESKSMYSTIELELQYLQSYMSLQKLKYGKKIDLQITVSSELLHYRIIKFILQPIVENSIKHGYMPQRQLQIEIDIALNEAKQIIFIIMDNGEGIPPDYLQKINGRFQSTGDLFSPDGNNGNSGGIGLGNINERLTLFYGKDYYLQMESIHGKYTKTILTIPFFE